MNSITTIANQNIQSRIYTIRGARVIIDRGLAEPKIASSRL